MSNVINSQQCSKLLSEREFLTRKELSRVLSVPVQTLADWASRGEPELPYIRFGRIVRYRSSDVQEFIRVNIRTRA